MTFAAATAVEAVADGRYAATVDDTWSAPLGPNGGYLAAMVLRAMAAALADQRHVSADDPAKQPRSLTCHYLAPPAGGPVDIEVQVIRSGRATATLTATMLQGGKPCVSALAVFGVVLGSGADYEDASMPDVPPPDRIEPAPRPRQAPAMFGHLDLRWALGPKIFSGGEHAHSGGWLGLAAGGPWDAPALAFATDAWVPAPWTRLTALSPAPTLDLTIHFRRSLPHTSAPEGHVLIEVTSKVSAEGFSDEDALVWAPDGTLLAQSRQLALLRPPIDAA